MANVPDVTGLRPGDPESIAGYRVVSRLGAGGQGVVYLGESPSGIRVAIKQLRFGFEDERARQQLVKEVAAARRVAPFCTARVLAAELHGPSPYVVSEYIDGLSLQQRVERHGVLTGDDLHRLAVGTVTALAAIHQAGVVHRDFKPANVMLAADGPRVIDFGIARDLSTETTVTSRVFGTPVYMAPEQLRAERIGPATDLFAWASVIAYAATGREPFAAPHVMAVMHRISAGEPDLAGVPADLVPVLRPCLEKDPARRPTAQQVLARLLGRPAPARDVADPTLVLAEATDLVHPPSAPPSAPPPATPSAALSGPPSDNRPWGAGQLPADRVGTARPPGRSRTALLVAAVLVLVLGGGWALGRSGLLGGSADPNQTGAGATSSAATSTATVPRGADPVAEDTSTPTPVPVTTTPTDDSTEDDDNSGPGDGDPDGPVVPEVFDGDWQGQVIQPQGSAKTWTARLELDEGETEGRFEVVDLDCSGPVTVLTATDVALTLDAVVDSDPSGRCAARGTIRLTRLSTKRAAFRWQDAAEPSNTATGLLHLR